MTVRLIDPKRCFNPSAFGITTGDQTKNACQRHLPHIADDMIGESLLGIMVYKIRSTLPVRCEYRYLKEDTQ